MARVALLSDDVDLVAVNDPFTTAEFMASMLLHDTIHGQWKPHEIEAKNSKTLIVNEKSIAIFAFRNPEEIPWGDVGVDCVVESTGIFTDKDMAASHLKGGARKVIISAPSKDAPMFVFGVNEQDYKPELDIVSSASCTTNCLAPFVKIIHDRFGIYNARMNTIHSIIATEKTVDGPSSPDWMRGTDGSPFAIPGNIEGVLAVGKVLPALDKKITANACNIREVGPSYEEIKNLIKEESEGKLKGIIGYSEVYPSYSEILGDTRSGIFLPNSSTAGFPKYVHLLTMFDNEWGYSNRVVDLIRHISKEC